MSTHITQTAHGEIQFDDSIKRRLDVLHNAGLSSHDLLAVSQLFEWFGAKDIQDLYSHYYTKVEPENFGEFLKVNKEFDESQKGLPPQERVVFGVHKTLEQFLLDNPDEHPFEMMTIAAVNNLVNCFRNVKNLPNPFEGYSRCTLPFKACGQCGWQEKCFMADFRREIFNAIRNANHQLKIKKGGQQ